MRVNDLTLPIAHVPGHTMQVDWAGNDDAGYRSDHPGGDTGGGVRGDVAFSGMVFAYGYLDEAARLVRWASAGVRVLRRGRPGDRPDNASTASNQISRTDRARDVNASYADFLAHYGAAAVPTRSNRPRDKGHVEAGVKVVTNWVIHLLSDRVFACLDDLNDAVAAQVEAINDRRPFRGEPRSRREWFDDHERDELMVLPVQRGAGDLAQSQGAPGLAYPARHHQILGALPVGRQLGGRADHRHRDRGTRRRADHRRPSPGPAPQWLCHRPRARAAALRIGGRAVDPRVLPAPGAKVGPATVTALTRLLDGKAIEAQGYRSCMNILELGKRASGNRVLLEAACRELVDDDPHRLITYTAVKHRISALRAEGGQRPTTTGSSPGSGGAITASAARTDQTGGRDTSCAHLAGPKRSALMRSPPVIDALTMVAMTPRRGARR